MSIFFSTSDQFLVSSYNSPTIKFLIKMIFYLYKNQRKQPKYLKKKKRNIYKNDKAIFPSFINSTVSIENAEKVVKEPKSPTIKKYLKKISEISLLCT